MNINLDQDLLDPNGNSVHTSDTDATPFTVRNAVATALLTDGKDQHDNSATKMERYNLFVKVKTLHESDFESAAITLMRTAVLMTYGTFYAGFMVDILEGNGQKPKKIVKSMRPE